MNPEDQVAIAKVLNTDPDNYSVEDAVAIQRALFEDDGPQGQPAAPAPLALIPKAKHALFSVAQSNNYAELARQPMTQTNLVRDFSNSEIRNALAPDQYDHLLGRLRSSAMIFTKLADVPPPNQSFANWSQPFGCLFKDQTAYDHMRWTMLGMCLMTDDPVGMQYMWQGLRASCKNPAGPTMPESVRKALFGGDALREATIVRMLKCAICTCRKPHLGLLLLEALDREAPTRENGAHPLYSYASRRDLASIAVAIADAIFGSDKTRTISYEEDHKIWCEKLQDKAPKSTPEAPCIPDKATDVTAWKRLTSAILYTVGDALPERIVETLPRERQYTLGTLQVAVRCADHDTFFLEELLVRKHWSTASLSEAYREALHKYQGVRGPNLPKVLALLYSKQLLAWRSNDARRSKKTVTAVDDLAQPWATVVSAANGYAEVDVDSSNTVCMPSNAGVSNKATGIDPAVWMTILRAMVAAHDTDPLDDHTHEWDQSSPLFSSLIKVALRACLHDEDKTHIVEYMIGLSLEHASKEFSTAWHDIPRLVVNIAVQHTDVFPMLVKSMLRETKGEALHVNVCRFKDSLNEILRCTEYQEPCRLIVRALEPFGLPQYVYNEHTEANECTLGAWVRNFGQGLPAAIRKLYGADYAAFVNSKLETDLLAVLAGRVWSEEAKTDALEYACKERMPVVAQVLLRPPCNAKLLDGRSGDRWVAAITEFLYRPGNACAEAVVSNLQAQAESLDKMTRPAEDPPVDEPAAKQPRTD